MLLNVALKQQQRLSALHPYKPRALSVVLKSNQICDCNFLHQFCLCVSFVLATDYSNTFKKETHSCRVWHVLEYLYIYFPFKRGAGNLVHAHWCMPLTNYFLAHTLAEGSIFYQTALWNYSCFSLGNNSLWICGAFKWKINVSHHATQQKEKQSEEQLCSTVLQRVEWAWVGFSPLEA